MTNASGENPREPLFAVRVGPEGGPRWRVLVRAMTAEQAGALVGMRGHMVHSVELADKPPRTVFRPATCAVCQYPLRGVAERDRYVQCPECGMVAVPLTDDSIKAVLREAGRGWRRRVVLGMLAVLAGVAIVAAARALF